jgi:hypothetical protein
MLRCAGDRPRSCASRRAIANPVSVDPLNLESLGTRVSAGEFVDRVIFRSLSSASKRKAWHVSYLYQNGRDGVWFCGIENTMIV